MELHFLGTGGSYPTPERNVSSLAVRHGPVQMLFDCGEGTQRQLMRSKLSFMKTDAIFLSHFHGDHILGIPGLVQSMALNGRDAPLTIAGPEGTFELVEKLLSVGTFTRTFEVKAVELKPGGALDVGGVRVTCCAARHGEGALAFRADTPPRPGKFDKPRALELGIPEGPMFGRLQSGEAVTLPDGRRIEPAQVLGPSRPGLSVVYSGDTSPSPEIVQLAKGATVLVHEATALEELRAKADEYGHSTAKGAAETARDAGVRELFMFHVSPRYDSAEGHLEEARAVFPASHAPSDLEDFTIGYE